jgi:cytoskeleton protein RodZ
MGKSIGETLREGRLHQRLSVAECAKRTHISPRYIEALEEEHWNILPSESHRLGFLRLYARFLGVYTEDMIQTYRQAQQQSPSVEKPIEVSKPPRPQPASNYTWPRLSLLLIFALVGLYGLYHGIHRFRPNPHVDLSWLKVRNPGRATSSPSVPAAPRLVNSKRDIQVQHIRARADADSWLRVVDNRQLIFEGILPAGAVKEWSGPGPFRIKVGNVNAIAIYWNDQPVNVKAATHGNVADLKLPPTAE